MHQLNCLNNFYMIKSSHNFNFARHTHEHIRTVLQMIWNILGMDFWLQDKEIRLKHNILTVNSSPNGYRTSDASLSTSSKQNALNSVTRARQNLLKSQRKLKWNCASWGISQPVSRIVHNTLIRAATYGKGKTQGLLHWFFKSTISSYAVTF